MTRVVVVEDHVLFAESLSLALRLDGHDVHRLAVGARSTRGDLVPAVLSAQPAVALLDLDLGRHVDGADLIGPIAAAGIDTLVVTGCRDLVEWGRCLHLGARAVIPKHAPLAEILAAVRRLTTGQSAMPRQQQEVLIAGWRDQGQRSGSARERLARLTRREREVLDGLADGQRIHDIAVADKVSEATVRTQVKAILSKLEVRSQLEAVLLLHEHARPRATARGGRRR